MRAPCCYPRMFWSERGLVKKGHRTCHLAERGSAGRAAGQATGAGQRWPSCWTVPVVAGDGGPQGRSSRTCSRHCFPLPTSRRRSPSRSSNPRAVFLPFQRLSATPASPRSPTLPTVGAGFVHAGSSTADAPRPAPLAGSPAWVSACVPGAPLGWPSRSLAGRMPLLPAIPYHTAPT
jgi:hypothetical protein